MRFLYVAALVAFTLPAHAQVYKCQEGGRTTYSDAPCSGRASVLGPDTLQGNTLPRDERERLRRSDVQPLPTPATIPGQAAASCPSEQDIRNLETKLTSIDFDGGRRRKEREFLQQEVRRARACRIEGGTYTAEDWRRIKEAQDAQGNLRPQDRQRERDIAKDIHAPNASDQEQRRMQADEDEDALRDAIRRGRGGRR